MSAEQLGRLRRSRAVRRGAAPGRTTTVVRRADGRLVELVRVGPEGHTYRVLEGRAPRTP